MGDMARCCIYMCTILTAENSSSIGEINIFLIFNTALIPSSARDQTETWFRRPLAENCGR